MKIIQFQSQNRQNGRYVQFEFSKLYICI